MSWHKEQQGFLTVATNSEDVDYLNLAYLQALNIKATQKIKSYAVIVDSETNKKINEDIKKYLIILSKHLLVILDLLE